jgi:hypothetical protein
MKKGGVRELFFCLWVFLVEMSKSHVSEGVWGVFIPPLTRGYFGYISGYSRHWGPDTPVSENFTDGEHLPGDSGYMSRNSERLCPDIRDQFPKTLGLA